MERCKLEIKRAYDTLIQMGERPTRPIRCNLYWKTVLFGGEQFYQDTGEDEKLFYYGTAEPRRAPHPTETDVILSHWVAKKCDSMKDYNDGRIFATLSNEFLSIIQEK